MGVSTSYELTESQHELVTRFLKKSAYQWRLLDSKARKHSIYQLKKAVHAQMEAYYRSELDDRDFSKILKSIEVKSSGWIHVNLPETTPVEQEPVAVEPVEVPEPDLEPESIEVAIPDEIEENEDAVFLGVCESWANQLNLSTIQVRAVWGFLGVVAGPFAAIAYFLGYGERIFSRHLHAPKRSQLNTSGIIYAGSGLTIWMVTVAFRQGIYLAGGSFTEGDLILGKWDWIQYSGSTVSFWAMLSLITMSFLLILPTRARSRNWIRHASRFVLTLYAVAMCYGMGRILTGFLMRTTEL